jgi:hypothetical protein
MKCRIGSNASGPTLLDDHKSTTPYVRANEIVYRRNGLKLIGYFPYCHGSISGAF